MIMYVYDFYKLMNKRWKGDRGILFLLFRYWLLMYEFFFIILWLWVGVRLCFRGLFGFNINVFFLEIKMFF